MANMTSEHEAGDVACSEELERAQKDQGRLWDDLDCSSDALTAATKEFQTAGLHTRPRALTLHAKNALQRTLEVKRKATEIQEDVAIHRERTRRITNQAAARATHSLTCGVPDRESNETKYLREATELIEEWQHQLLSGQPMSGPPSEHGEVILVEQ